MMSGTSARQNCCRHFHVVFFHTLVEVKMLLSFTVIG